MKLIPPPSSRFTFLLGMIAGLPALSIDLSAPSLAVLPAALNTTVFVAGLSLSLFVLGFGVGQFAGGRASDGFGRRPILLIALAIYAFSGACCTLATSGGALATARLGQGAAAGACSVQAYAMVQDLFTGEMARRKQAYVSVVLSIMPMLAPAMGAGLIMLYGWRSIHVTMAAGGAVLIALVGLCVGETRSAPPVRDRRGLGFVNSVWMLRDEGFRRIVIVNALSYASIFAYIAGAPVVVISQFGYSNAVYAGVFACTAVALSAGAMFSARLVRKVSSGALVWPALVAQAIANLGLVLGALALPAVADWALLPLLLVGCFMRGIISPNLVHHAISSHREQAGLAAALVGLAQLMTAAASSALLARLLEQFGAVSVAITMAALSLSAVTLWRTTNLGEVVAERS